MTNKEKVLFGFEIVFAIVGIAVLCRLLYGLVDTVILNLFIEDYIMADDVAVLNAINRIIWCGVWFYESLKLIEDSIK